MKPTPIKEHVVRVGNALTPDKLAELLDYVGTVLQRIPEEVKLISDL